MAQAQTFSKSRVEALTDGIFSVVMTLLVLDVKLPKDLGHLTDGELWNVLASFEPKLSAYMISFIVSAVFWLGHHALMQRVRCVNRVFLWLNLGFLFSLTFLPFTADLIGEHPHVQSAVLLYGVNLLAILSLQWLLWRYLYQHAELQDGEMTPADQEDLSRRYQLTLLIAVAAVALSFVSPRASIFAYALWVFVVLLRLRAPRRLSR
jgi:uncharacterized membrane protein